MMLTEPYIETDIQAYLYTYGSWLLLILPSLWLYMKTRAKKKESPAGCSADKRKQSLCADQRL